MSLVDSLKKGLFGSEDEYEDQYIDDGPQMVNNNNGVGLGADDETEEPAEGAKKNKVVNIHATTQLKVVLVKPERFEDVQFRSTKWVVATSAAFLLTTRRPTMPAIARTSTR